MAKCMSAKVEETNIGRIESIFCQYSRNTHDFQCPCIVTTSRGVPHKSNSVAPPILKQWLDRTASLFCFQTWLDWFMNQVHVIGDQPPFSVSKANKSASAGMDEFARRWWLRAETELDWLLIHDMTMLAPSPWVVLVHGMVMTMKETPVGEVPQCMGAECEMWCEGLNENAELMMSSPSLGKQKMKKCSENQGRTAYLQHDQKAVEAMAKTDMSNTFERSRW